MEKQRLSTGAWELCALVLVLALLWFLATPLAPLSLGLDQRYLSDGPGTSGLNVNEWLCSHAAQALTALACAGYLSLRLARLSITMDTAMLGWAEIWIGALIWLGLSQNWTGTEWLAFILLASWSGLLLGLLVALIGAETELPAQQPVHALAYPGFVLFTGLGALWLLDCSARGKPQWLGLGQQHFMVLTVAYAALGLVTRFAPGLFQACARLCARWDRSTTGTTLRQRLGTQWSPWVLCAATTMLIAFNTNPLYPSTSAEAIKLVICLMGAWLIYRWSPLPHHLWRITLGVGLLAVLGTAGLMLIKEFGQLMVLTWVASVLCGTLVAWGWLGLGTNRSTAGHGPRRRLTRNAVAALAGSAVACSVAWSGQALLRSDALVPYLQSHRHIAMRVAAIQTEGQGPLSYLSELRWFMHSAPLTGHGLGHVPWCGTVGQFGKAWASCEGVPKEMQFDYVFAALAGVWGWPGALLITASLALWWLSLLRPQTMRLGKLNSSGLTQAFGLCFVTVTLMQLLVTCLGNIGFIPLTGVNYPFLGFGGASLLACTVGMGVLLHRPSSHA